MQRTTREPTPGMSTSSASGPASPALVKMRQKQKIKNAKKSRTTEEEEGSHACHEPGDVLLLVLIHQIAS